MTSSPGIQLIGVVMRFLSPLGGVSFCSNEKAFGEVKTYVWRESRIRRTSAVLRPVEAG